MTGKDYVSELLKSTEGIEIGDADYSYWKEWYETQSESDKVSHLLGAVAQYFMDPDSHAARGILVSAVICTQRWTSEKDFSDFNSEIINFKSGDGV